MIGRDEVYRMADPVPAVPVPIGAVVVPLPKGAEVVGIGDSTGVDSTGAELAGTVTVTVLAEVTVTVAGPHSPPAADEAPTGESPLPLETG